MKAPKHCKHISPDHYLTCSKNYGLNGSSICRELLMFQHKCDKFRFPDTGEKRPARRVTKEER